jgi:hypothetical protein
MSPCPRSASISPRSARLIASDNDLSADPFLALKAPEAFCSKNPQVVPRTQSYSTESYSLQE